MAWAIGIHVVENFCNLSRLGKCRAFFCSTVTKDSICYTRDSCVWPFQVTIAPLSSAQLGLIEDDFSTKFDILIYKELDTVKYIMTGNLLICA